jgi:hypothetical protein
MSTTDTNAILNKILMEVQTLRQEVSFFIPSEKLSDYNNSANIKKAYLKALQKHPLHENRTN